MRITKKIISLLLVVSMLASFMAMTGFEASASLINQNKTDFGLHFDDTTRKFKVLQLSDIQTDFGDPNIALTTKETIRMAIEQYQPDLIMLSGDQVQGGSGLLASLSDWKSSINAVFNTFTPHLPSGCKVVAVPGNHEYEYDHLGDQWEYYRSQSWYLDWDNNFSTVDLNGEPGAGNVTVSAGSDNKAVALNIALFNSKGDDEDGYLRPGGDDNAAYQQIVDWYRATNNTLASSAYSYKAQVTGASTAYVPAFAMQHVILQEIYNSMEACGSTEGVAAATDGNYSSLLNASYMKFKSGLSYVGVLGEAPCPSTLGAGATTALYNALLEGDFLGMAFGHDHLNTFDITDSNGFRFLMGGALTTENYNNGNPNVRYMEFTLDDTTGEVELRSETNSFNEMTNSAITDVSPDRIEAINGNGVQFTNTISVPKTIYIGSTENNADPRAVQKKGTNVQPLLLDYETKNNYEQDLNVSFCLPEDATITEFTVKRNAGSGTAVTMTENGTESTAEGTLYKYLISTGNALTDGETLLYTVKFTTSDGRNYEIYNSSQVENIKMPAGYTDWFRSWRRSNNASNYCDLHYVGTLSGANAYSFGRDTGTNSGNLVSNIHYNYSSPGTDVDSMWVNHNGDSFYSMYFWSPSRVEETSLISKRNITNPPQTDIYLDTSALKPVSTTDERLDTGVRIDFWMPMNQGRGFTHYAAGIGFYAGDQDFIWNGTTIDPGDAYATYDAAVDAEENSMSSGTADDASVFVYDSYAGQQSYAGLGTTHVNHNNDDDNKVGNLAGQSNGWPLVVDSESAALALNNVGMTMFTGVRVRGADSNGARQLNYAIAPYYLMFHTYDKGELRELALGELINPRVRTDYPNATDLQWDAYISAYKNALACYAQTKTTDADVDNYHKLLNDAIVALLNSNKGKPDESNLLKGTSQFGSIDVPPIIYVSGTTIQTAPPYTDRAITYTVPAGATNVSCVVVNQGNDNVNSAVTTSTTNNGTSYTTTITGGTATAGGSIYYKLSYTLPGDKNKDGADDTYTQYAASYVKDAPNTTGVWATRTRRNGGFWNVTVQKNTRIHLDATVNMESNILGSRGVSGIVALYGGVQGTSFSSNVVNNSGNTSYSRYGTGEKVGWSVGTTTWGNGGYNAAAGKVTFYQNRDAVYLSYTTHKDAYYNGLRNYTENSGSRDSDEYIVTHIYFDPQATGASVKPQLKLTLVAVDGHQPWVRRYWDANNYTANNYGGTYTANTISSSGMFAFSGTGNNWENENDDDGKIITDIVNDTTYTMYFNTVNALSSYQTSYSRMVLQSEKQQDGDYNYSTIGFAFVLNRVNKSIAHEWINGVVTGSATGVGTATKTATPIFNQADMDPTWWSNWRTEIMKAYIACGNLWGSDFDPSLIDSYKKNPIYKDADYSKLVEKINEITNAGLTLGSTEYVLDYNALKYNVNSGDDSRYVGNSFEKTMYMNNAADLIATIRNRTSVYGDVDKSGKTVSEANKNFHLAHLDICYQGYIDDYVVALQQAWDKLRLQSADYTVFDKFTNYYNSTNDTILFMRDEYAGYNNGFDARNYANEKNLQSAMFTADTRKAFIDSLNIDPTLKKPSESAVVTVYEKNSATGKYEPTNETLPRIYPAVYTYKNVTSPDTTVCYYNTARDAYEDLEFRRAGEYYSADGTYTEDGVTYHANYNKFDRGNSYYYTPVFTATYNDLTADITNAGFAVTDAKVKPTYTAGNSGDKDNDGYDEDEIWVTNGAGEYIKAIPPWTEASWGGGNVYGFKNAYEEQIAAATSTYQTTNDSTKWVLALYVEAEILPDIALVDYYYDKLVPSSYDLGQYNYQKDEVFAPYELGGGSYNAAMALLANNGYVPCDAQGNPITGGAAWYEAASWSEYLTSKEILPNIIDGANLKENQDAINYATSVIYQKREELQHKLITEFMVKDSEGNIKTFDSILADLNAKRAEIQGVQVDVFGLRGNEDNVVTPKTYADATQNGATQGPLFVKHNYYNDSYITALSGKITVVNGFADKDAEGKDKTLAGYLEQYLTAVNDFTSLYNDRANPAYVNKANTYYLEILLNKDWIPPYDKYGTENAKPTGGWFLGEEFDGSSWYTEESWDAYVEARNNAVNFFGEPDATQGATAFDGYKVFTGTYYGTASQPVLGKYTVADQGAKFSIDLDPASPTYGKPIAVDGTSLEGTVNKATYDLVVAYYKLQYKKVSDFDGTIEGVPGTGYSGIITELNGLISEKENVKVDVVILNANGELETVQKSIYGDEAISELRTLAAEIAKLENEDLGPKYLEYVEKVNACKKAIDELEEVSVYLDGWNGIFAHLNENAGDVATISESGNMTAYFNAVYDGFNPDGIYAEGGTQSINNIFTMKQFADSMSPTAKSAQAQYNGFVTNLYNELNALALTPKQVTSAAQAAMVKLSQASQPAYDPIQLNGRAKVQGISKFSPASVTEATNLVTAVNSTKVTLWDTKPAVTGYNNGAGVVVDGSLADEIWAAVGLTNASGTKDYDGADRDGRYKLVEGGQFVDALNDAIAYAKQELYEADGVTVKQFEVVAGDGTVTKSSIFTDESVKELTDALAAAVVTDTTTQAQIDQWVFDILENTDIDNKISLLAEDGTFYGSLNNIAEDEGLKYKPADYSYLNTELATALEGKSDGAQALINKVWIDNGDGTYTLDPQDGNANGAKYFTSETWTPYYNNYSNALNPNIVPRDLTANDQDKINTYTTGIYTTRNALKWNGIDDNTWLQINAVGNQIGNLESATFEVLTFTNSRVQILEDGTRVLTAPTVGSKNLSAYGDVSHILSLWETFRANYIDAEGVDITKQAEMLEKLREISDILNNLETKRFDTSESNEFTEGVRNLIDSFIAGTYTFNGLSSSDGVGTYVADYQAVAENTNVSAYERNIRSQQSIFIQSKLNALYTIIGSGMEVGDQYQDHSTGSLVIYSTAIEAINAIAYELFEYLTTTPAVYAGFGLEMRQAMYDYLSTEIVVSVSYRYSASSTVYTKSVPMFSPEMVEGIKAQIDGSGVDGDYGVFGTPSSWPTINLLNNGVGIELNENVQYDQTIYKMPVEYIEETGETIYQDVYVGSNIIGPLSGYSPFYSSSIDGGNMHHVEALGWLMSQAVVDTSDGTYILADTNGTKEIDSAVFRYSMEIDSKKKDGEWYTKSYGTDIYQDGTRYYLAAHPTNKVTGSNYGGWFTDVTYEAVVESRNKAIPYIEKYSSCPFGKGTAASQFIENLSRENATGTICWNKSNRDAYIANVKADQKSIDDVAGSIYGSICELKLLPATDAYRYVAGLIYDALGVIPTYSDDNKTDIIIPEEEGNGVGELKANQELGGRLFNQNLLGSLAQHTTSKDENGKTIYYSTQLPGSYNGGANAVKAILTQLDTEIKNDGIVTIDKADALVLADTNSVKARIVAELEKLTLGLADLSKITSLTKAFLFNNPANADSLGSYDINDNSVGQQFFETEHVNLGSQGTNAGNYREDKLMQQATGVYHASGFYDFTKYKEDSLRDVINFLKNNDIITATTQGTANNFNIINKTGFNIEFDPKDGGALYSTPATQQGLVDEIYNDLVYHINSMELEKAKTESLKADIVTADDIVLNADIYDHTAVDNGGNNIWEEFEEAYSNAKDYQDVTVINTNQVLQAEDRLEKAIKALVLYVDTFAPVVTIHNTQTDLNKFYAEHASELGNTITSADQMKTVSYMEPGLGGYTLYVYTNQLNPHIVVSLKDTTSILNEGDGSTRTVTASKPEKLSVSAQAMSGVTANVITPVLDATTGMALTSVSTTLTGATTMTAQTSKNAEGTYDADSSAYIILNPQFSDEDGTQQAAAYTIGATDSAVTKDTETGEITAQVNGVEKFNYANSTELIETTEDGKITVFVYYMNAMPADGDDSGFAADGTANESAVLTYPEKNGFAADKWVPTYGLLRQFNKAVKAWEFSDIDGDLNEGAVYIDPTFGENNFGSFIYKLDPAATEGLDYDVAKIYFEKGATAAEDAFISALNSNTDYIAALDTESKNPDSTKYISYGSYDNYNQHLAFIDNGTLMFVHVADRFGNVCNRIIEVKNYDRFAPQLTATGTGAVSVVEPGGSGVAKVDLFKYMGTQGSSLYIDYLFEMLHINDFTYVSEDNKFTIKAGAASAGKHFTVAVTDKAGNVGSVPVYADENGDIVVEVVETFDNVAEYAANTKTDIGVNTSEDLEVIEFTFNGNQTIILNYSEPSSIVKAGPDGNVFANKKNVPLNITTKSEVEAVKLYNVAAGTEEIWTADNATVTDNGDGTKTWTVKYKFTEGEHSYVATAKVDGNWETFGVDFSFTATTKSVTVKLTVAGIGKIRFGYNEGNYSNVPVMSQKSVPYGSVVTLEAVQTEEGSDFYYWINNGSNRIISASETYEFTAVTTMDLTTQFTTNECFDNDKRLVVYVNNAENVIENFELAEGEDYKVPAAPSLPDHVFKSWSMTKEEVLASDEMMIIVRPVYSLVVKNTVTLTEGNWTTTGAGVYESVDNERAVVTVSASAADDAGASFLYWLDAETGDIASYNRTYTFHAIKDTELTPVYGDASAVVPAPVARISTVKYDSNSKKVNFYAERSIPAEYELIQTGVIVTKSASVGADEQGFILDAAGVGKGVSKSTATNGFYTGAVSATAGTTVYARAYVIYTNADGDIITSYSPISSYTV